MSKKKSKQTTKPERERDRVKGREGQKGNIDLQVLKNQTLETGVFRGKISLNKCI